LKFNKTQRTYVYVFNKLFFALSVKIFEKDITLGAFNTR